MNISCIISAVLIAFAIRKIWNSLKLNPALQRNERIMTVHLTFIAIFIFTSLVMVVANIYATKHPNQGGIKALFSFSAAFDGIFNTAALLLILFLAYRFTLKT